MVTLLWPEVSFFGKLLSKNQHFLLKLKFRTYTNLNMENWMMVFFPFLDRKRLFLVKLVQKLKTIC